MCKCALQEADKTLALRFTAFCIRQYILDKNPVPQGVNLPIEDQVEGLDSEFLEQVRENGLDVYRGVLDVLDQLQDIS